MGLKIAIGGKGGVGKTSICAILAQLFSKDGFDVLAVDADPNTNLCCAFGIDAKKSPTALIEMKELIAERTGTGKDAVGAYFRLNPKVNDLPDKYCLEVEGLKLLVLGGIEHGGAGCACPEGAFLKAMLTHTMLQRNEVVFVDLAAGPEFFGRASVQGIDALVIVVEPGSRSIETAISIANMGRELGIKKIVAILNKVTEHRQVDIVKEQLGDMKILASIDYNPAIQQADLRRENVLLADEGFVEKVCEAKSELISIINSDADSSVGVEQ